MFSVRCFFVTSLFCAPSARVDKLLIKSYTFLSCSLAMRSLNREFWKSLALAKTAEQLRRAWERELLLSVLFSVANSIPVNFLDGREFHSKLNISER
ncbi:hypothetical protein D6817_02215 [Candidatus Pacearchaeota archaeon]|nr:MAG: hypothetical protein D6817_02215 [Candidatus Pacearchaeota archaeon]